MRERPPSVTPGNRFRFLRWMRKARLAWMLAFAGLVFWVIVSPLPRRVPGLNALFEKLETAENSTRDLRFHWRGAEPPNLNVAILAITKASLHPSEVRPE